MAPTKTAPKSATPTAPDKRAPRKRTDINLSELTPTEGTLSLAAADPKALEWVRQSWDERTLSHKRGDVEVYRGKALDVTVPTDAASVVLSRLRGAADALSKSLGTRIGLTARVRDAGSGKSVVSFAAKTAKAAKKRGA